jgi:hypothetical protein
MPPRADGYVCAARRAAGGEACGAAVLHLVHGAAELTVFRVAAAVVVLRGSAIRQAGRSASFSHGAQNCTRADGGGGTAARGIRSVRRTIRARSRVELGEFSTAGFGVGVSSS